MAVVAILCLYGAFLAIGVLASRRARGGAWSDLLVAGRAMPLWLAVLTMTATWVDGGYLLGTVEGTIRSGLASGGQGGLCFGASLVLGGLFFARRMRACRFTTLIDPFEVRFGRRWALVLLVPALLGELFWSAELLVAIGSTLGVMLGMPLMVAIVLSAAVVVAYTALGGMWSVAYTDAVQLALVAIGLAVAVPVVFEAAGGVTAAWQQYAAARPSGVSLLPPAQASVGWPMPAIVSWWDVSAMLVMGGIPWNCYFQRVLSCQTPSRARWHSILAGLLTMAFTLPPLLIGIGGLGLAWPPDGRAALEANPAGALPMILQFATPPLVALLGLGAIIAAVTSSFSSSILSAASMCTWNGCYRLLGLRLSDRQMARLVRFGILGLGVLATTLALEVQSVQALWFFTSDLVFVLLFPQLVFALFDRRVNRIGSITAFAVSLALRLGGGEPLFGIPPVVPYPHLFAAFLPGTPESWYDPTSGALLFPVKTLAAVAGVVLLPVVSRLTARWDAPRPRPDVQAEGDR